MTKEIFKVFVVLVAAFLGAKTLGWGVVLGSPGNVFLILWLAILALVSFAEDKSADAALVSRWLKRRDGPMLYTRSVQGLLRVLDRMIMPDTAANQPLPAKGMLARFEWFTTPRAADAGDLARLRECPWSWPVYDKALMVAVAYPLLFAMAQWAATGQATGLGNVTLFPAEDREWLRYIAFSLIVMSLIVRLVAAFTSQRVFEVTAKRLAQLILACAVVYAVSVENAKIFAVIGGLTYAISSAIFRTGAVVVALAGGLVVQSTVANAHGIAIAGAIAFATIPALFLPRRKVAWGFSIFTFLLVTVLFAIALTVGFPDDDPRPASLWLFLGLFPLINAIFDWLSYGLTIWLIRRGFREKGMITLFYGILDIIAAAIMFFGLSLTLTCIVGWLNPAMAVPLIDLPALFADLHRQPQNHIWVIGMVFSTLVPTLVHLVIVALSAITWAPPKLRVWIERGIDARAESGIKFNLAAITLSAVYAAYAFVLTWGIFKLAGAAWAHRQPMLSGYIDAVETAARSLGAL